jgi:tetratricopeptide (TPR) repeat protein
MIDVDTQRRLRFHLEMEEGFWVGVVVGDDRGPRRELRELARRQAEELDLPFHLHRIAREEGAFFAQALATDTRPGVHWVVTDPPEVSEWITPLRRVLLAMNERRDGYRRSTPAGLVLEGTHELKVLLRNLAPDLFAIRSLVLEPGGPSAWVLPGQVRSTEESESVEPEGSGLVWLDGDVLNWRKDTARAAVAEARRLADVEGQGALRSRIGAAARAVDALLAQGWVTEAAPLAEENLELLEQMREETTGVAGRWATGMLAETLGSLAMISRSHGDLALARERWRLAADVQGALIAGEPLDPSNVAAYDNIARYLAGEAEIAREQGDLDAAESLLHRALAVRRELATLQADDVQLRANIAIACSQLGDVKFDAGDRQGARDAYAEALEVRERLVDRCPDVLAFRRHASVAWGRIGRVSERDGDLVGADLAHRMALELVRQVAEVDPGNVQWQIELSVALGRAADTAILMGDLEPAERALRQSVAIRSGLCDEDPENARWTHLLAVAVGRLSEVLRRKGDPAGAVPLARRSMQLADSLCWQDPGNRAWRISRLSARRALGAALLEAGEPQAALAVVEEALTADDDLAAEPERRQALVDLRLRAAARVAEADH